MKYIQKLAIWLYDTFPLWKNATVLEDLKTLYPMKDITKKQKEYVIEKLSFGIIVLVVGGILGTLLMIKEAGTDYVENNQLRRGTYGEGSQNIVLNAKNGKEEASITVEVEERLYQEIELQEMYKGFLQDLKKVVLGENKTFDEISYDLDLVNCLEGYPFEIEWQIDEEYVDPSGKLIHNELSQAVVIEVTAQINCQEFKREETFWCCIRSRASPLTMRNSCKGSYRNWRKKTESRNM